VTRSVSEGAKVVTRRRVARREGYYYAPTVLDGVTPEMPAGAEETFGPAAAVLPRRASRAAIAIANASDFGLGASGVDRGPRPGRTTSPPASEAGCVFVNQLVKSDPRVPFGGVKDSGYGRELGPDCGHRTCPSTSPTAPCSPTSR
jgi:succinate-semialdehyde dehydrogenase / glutarate-semialdehyde dehydrogenase